MAELDLRRELVRAGRELYRQGMLAGAGGNLSARLPDGGVLITPSGLAKGRLRPADLLVLDLDGRGAGKPSSETPLHLAIYRRFPWVGAVVHAHPVNATALAVMHRSIPVETLPEGLVALGAIPCVPYVPPAGPALGEAVAPALDEGDGALLLNHGAVTIGRTVAEAQAKMEVLEALAAVALKAPQAVPLPAAEVERLRAIWRSRRATF